MRISIIGAGIAGLTAAYTLSHAGSDAPQITVFEKSRGLSGRAAMRWFDRPAGRVYVDHGAQYLKAESPVITHLLQVLPQEELTSIEAPVWTFNAHNHIVAGDGEHNAAPRWSYQHGINTLGRLLTAYTGLTVRTQVRIDHIRANADGTFTLVDIDGLPVGEFDQVIVAIPAGQAADLVMRSSGLAAALRDSIAQELAQARYRRCLSVVLGYDRALTARPYYALLNTDRAHAISWIGFEHMKPGHAPAGTSVLVVQMAGEFSLQQWDAYKEEVIAAVAQQAAALLGEDVATPDWSDMQKWRYSQPDVLADAKTLNGRVPGLWFCGDYLRGGRVHLAAESGSEVARAILMAGQDGVTRD